MSDRDRGKIVNTGLSSFFYKMTPYLFVSPFIIAFILFYVYPIIETGIMSLQEIRGPGDISFIYFENYKNLINHEFLESLLTNTWYTIWTLIVLIPIPIVLAVLLNNKKTPGSGFLKSVYFLPALTSIAVAGVFFRQFFTGMETTVPNQIIKLFGLPPRNWMFNYNSAMFVFVFICTWQWLGVNIIYFLAGLQNISTELYEAADIDGANNFQKFFFITLPGLKPVIIYLLTISISAGYSMFSIPYILYPNGRTPGNIGLTAVLYLYQQGFDHNNFGFASAIGITLLVIIFIISIIQLKFMGFFKKGGD